MNGSVIYTIGLIAMYTVLGFAVLWWVKEAIESEVSDTEGTRIVKIGAVILWPVIIVLVGLAYVYLSYREIRYGDTY